MKAIALAVLVLAIVFPCRADDPNNWILNSEFVDGLNHWYGGGRTPADFASDNPLVQSTDTFTTAGLIMPLRPETWTKVAQDFKGKVSNGVLTITYKVSKDFAFSTKPDDYVNMPDKIGYDAWPAFNTTPGTWVVFLSDFGSARGSYYMIQPKVHTMDPQTYQARIEGMTPYEDKTITLAFPPGSGMVVVLNVSMKSQ